MRGFRVWLLIFLLLLFTSFAVIGVLVLQLGEQKDLTVEKEKWEAEEEAYLAKIRNLEAELEALRQRPQEEQAWPETEEISYPEETEPAEPVLSYLEGLDELEPGDTVYSNEIDFNDLSKYFQAFDIVQGDEIYQRIYGKSYQENDNIGLEQLAYLKLLHYNFRQEIQVGELIVNKELAGDVLGIFQELFLNQYEIESMYLIDNYWAGDGDSSDYASIEANNTSAFNYRPITGGGRLSKHAFGRAIDINPQQNPYVWYDENGNSQWSHANADLYIDRGSGQEHMILYGDLCYQIFEKYGFSWGGNWNNPKDYQHFERWD